MNVVLFLLSSAIYYYPPARRSAQCSPPPNPDPCVITYLIRLIGQSPITIAFPQRANLIKCQATPPALPPFHGDLLVFFARCATTGCTLNPE